MIEYRAFCNSDPPLIAELWRSCVMSRGLMQPMSAALLDQLVLSKPFFDRQGLIVAINDRKILGYIHAGFGPTDDGANLSTEMGVTSMLMVHPAEPNRIEIGLHLLKLGEAYLQSKGAKLLYAGGIYPLDPFYLGLYGGSELPGVLQTNPQLLEIFQAGGYREIDRTLVFQLDLSSFRPLVDRQQMQIRRRTKIEVISDPPATTWWEACTRGGLDRSRYLLLPRDSEAIASVVVWNIEPLASSWGVRAGGLMELQVDAEHQHQGNATYLLGETFRQLQLEGITLIEAQTMARNTAAIGLYRKLGFHPVDQGIVLRKGT